MCVFICICVCVHICGQTHRLIGTLELLKFFLELGRMNTF